MTMPAETLPEFARNAINLASPRLGSKTVYATDEFFAGKARMPANAPASFDPDKYDDNGKYMDGWGTRRRREPGNDWIIVKLVAAGSVSKIEVDTRHYKGNYPDRCPVQGALVHAATDQSIVTEAMFWPELMGEQKLQMDDIHVFSGDLIKSKALVNDVKLNIFPDGGVSRFRVFGKLA
jgi:allantoicase